MTLLAQRTQGQRIQSYEPVAGMVPPAQFPVLPAQGSLQRGLSTIGELQDIQLKTHTVLLPQASFACRQRERITFESEQYVRPTLERASQSPPQKSILGQAGIEFGPVADLEYAKYLLEQEQITIARVVLERAIKRYPQEGRLQDLYRVIIPGRVERRTVNYRHQKVEAAWIKTHRTQYHGKWVALLGKQVLGVGDDLHTVLNLLRDYHLDESPLIHHFD